MLTNWISPDKYIEYLEAFGFGSQVGLPLPSESAGTLPTDWDLTQKMTAGFGQGILTTPIQHIQAISAILNGGQIIKPQLISQVYDSNTEEMIYEFKAELGETPITAQTAEQVKQLMVGVTSNKTGSGRLAYSLNVLQVVGRLEQLRLQMEPMVTKPMSICIVISDLLQLKIRNW